MAIRPISVTQLNTYIERVLGTDPLLGAVVVKGEITNLKYHSSGHVYFSIADVGSKINCFFQREYVVSLQEQLMDGMEVIVTGSISVYKKNGTYSIYVKSIEHEGAGDLSVAFQQLKDKLNKEGLFDPSHKKPIPKFPQKIGLITASTGAAVQDMLKILRNRNQMVDIMIFPVLVQGDGAGQDIAQMIDLVNEQFDDIDTIIVGRGGGSADDLWAFNEEIVARSIYQSHIPIISAVGHEIDFTISDLVADLRAETPTAAAQIAVPDAKQLKDKLIELQETLYLQLSNKLMYNRLYIDNLKQEMTNQINDHLLNLRRQLDTHKLILEENNPKKVMQSGYSMITDKQGHIVSSIQQLTSGERYHISMKDGQISGKFTEIGSDQHE